MLTLDSNVVVDDIDALINALERFRQGGDMADQLILARDTTAQLWENGSVSLELLASWNGVCLLAREFELVDLEYGGCRKHSSRIPIAARSPSAIIAEPPDPTGMVIPFASSSTL
ncbi:MAG: hypothetical protein R6W06_14815 [Prochlorococcaceae cyanobacterium]